jgi:hypothetical protein
MTNPSPTPNSPLPSEARWDDLAEHLPKTVGEFGLWLEAQLATLEGNFCEFVTLTSGRAISHQTPK